jgi:magnesium transporter
MGELLTGVKEIEEKLAASDFEGLSLFLRTKTAQELVDIVIALSSEDRTKVFLTLPADMAADVFEFLPLSYQKELINQLPSDRAAVLLNAIDPDDRVAFFEELPSPVVNGFIKLLSPKERAHTLKLLGYPEGSVGRVMTPDYIAIGIDWTVSQVLDYVRQHVYQSEIVEVVYVVDNKGKLLDDIKLIEFVLAPLDKKVSDLADKKYVVLLATDPAEQAVATFRKYGRFALPVTDAEGALLGIVTMDDILEISEEETTEDIQKYGGMEALDAPYFETPFIELIKKRAGWLVILFLGEMMTATAMGYFQEEIAKAVVLTLFLPLIMSSGGNSGSQASTLIIRAMTLREVRLRDWWRVFRREIGSGIVLGCILGSIAFLRISIWTMFTNMYGPHWMLLGFTVFLALIGIVTWGTFTGSAFPMVLRWMRVDPAVASAPFVATLIDVTGIVIYFYIALLLLSGTLL